MKVESYDLSVRNSQIFAISLSANFKTWGFTINYVTAIIQRYRERLGSADYGFDVIEEVRITEDSQNQGYIIQHRETIITLS